MKTKTSILLIAILWGFSAYADTKADDLLLRSLKMVFTDHNTEKKQYDLLSKGIWNKTKTAFVVSDRVGTTDFIYAFIEIDNNFLPIKLWEFDKDKPISKFGQKLSYFDRYEITPSLSEFNRDEFISKHGDQYSKSEINKIINYNKEYKISVSYRLRAWKKGKRWTGDYKPVQIRNNGSVDWSQY